MIGPFLAKLKRFYTIGFAFYKSPGIYSSSCLCSFLVVTVDVVVDIFLAIRLIGNATLCISPQVKEILHDGDNRKKFK